MKRTVFQSLVAALLGCVIACGSGLNPVNPPSFIRPERVAFTCVRTDKAGRQVPVPLEQCSACRGHSAEHSLYAFVTQTTRGELAAVDLEARRVIDTQTTVPGYTFVPVGETPSALIVPTRDPRYTFVANLGSSDLRVLDTKRLLGATATTDATLAIIPLGQLIDGQWQDAEPVDMVLADDEARLVIAAPRLHGVLVVDIADVVRVVENGEASAVAQTLVTLHGLSTDATLVTTTASDRYSLTCGGVNNAEPSQDVELRTVEATVDDAMPVALTVDALNRRVLVADAALPIIHAVDMATLTEVLTEGRPLYVTDAPTLDVVMSPPVPAAIGDAATERYIYAIDAEHRDVLVLNERGIMQSVNALGAARPDRIDLGGLGTSTIEVIEPSYRDCATIADPAPRNLKGVFLAASMIDGAVRVVDVHDLDAERRCVPGPNPPDDIVACGVYAPCVAIQRHRPRIGGTFLSPRACVAPTAQELTGLAAPLPAVATARRPTLGTLTKCSAGMTAAFNQTTDSSGDPSFACPDSTATPTGPVVCVASDPWTANREQWVARWEGPIAGASVSAGTLDDDGRTFVSHSLDLCAAGVEGGEKFEIELFVPEADTELIAAYDQTLPAADRDALAKIDCSLFTAVRSNGTRPRLALSIESATVDTLKLKDIVDVPEGFTADDVLAAARHCVAGMLFPFAIRSYNRYTVTGATTGFAHRVTNVDGKCVGPQEGDVLSAGQAVVGKPFENTNVAFVLNELIDNAEPPQDLFVSFVVSAAPSLLGLDTNISSNAGVEYTIVPELRYSPTDMRLYAVDSASRGLLPITLNPFSTSVSSGSAFR